MDQSHVDLWMWGSIVLALILAVPSLYKKWADVLNKDEGVRYFGPSVLSVILILLLISIYMGNSQKYSAKQVNLHGEMEVKQEFIDFAENEKKNLKPQTRQDLEAERLRKEEEEKRKEKEEKVGNELKHIKE